MKIYSRFKICGFIIFTAFFVGCSTANTSSMNDELEVKVSSPIVTDPINNYEAKFTREEGWVIPLPEKKKQTKTLEMDVMSANGKKVKRTVIIYIPTDDFFFQREASTFSDKQLVAELLKLQSIYQAKVNEKIYSYTVFAQKTTLDKQTGKPTATESKFFYRYFDLNGDGKFETLIADDSEVLVPSWVVQ